jgi:hypothetical protein
MNVITEREKQQLLEGDARLRGAATSARARLPAPPPLCMEEFLRQVEQLARILPQSPRPFAGGTRWKL